MNDSLRNKVVVVTGASSGMGKSIVLESASRGAHLILVARNEARLSQVAREAKELSGNEAHIITCDLKDTTEIETACQKIEDLVDHVDILVNSAGYGKFENFMDSDFEHVEDMFRVDVLGLMYFTRLIGRMMIKHNSGQIINFGSIAGKVPTTKTAAYSAAKAAVIQFSNVLRLELKPFGIHVMTVNPGPVYTNFFNIADQTGKYAENVSSFMLDPDDVAWQVVQSFGSSRRELNLPISLAVLAKLYNLFPTIGDVLSIEFASRK
ncbi:MAG: SDR family oxidoreductase [Lactobacillus sp.]|nr:SDR family oxidoreductase [Lactobacillus sp.]